MTDISHILVPSDGSDGSLAAAAFARDLARKLGSKITVLHVLADELVMPHAWGPGAFPKTAPFGSMSIEEIRAMLEERARSNELPRTAEKLGELESQADLVVSWGHPAQEICRFADEQHADMIVMGSHGRSGLGRALLGSVSHAVANQAPCPVTIVR